MRRRCPSKASRKLLSLPAIVGCKRRSASLATKNETSLERSYPQKRTAPRVEVVAAARVREVEVHVFLLARAGRPTKADVSELFADPSASQTHQGRNPRIVAPQKRRTATAIVIDSVRLQNRLLIQIDIFSSPRS